MKQTLARWISIVAHPFVTGTVMVAAAASIRIAAAFVILAVVPMLVLSFRQVRRGTWEHVDASNRRERPRLYAMGIAAALVLFAYIAIVHPGSHLVRSIPITVGMLLVCAIATRWVKISLHMLFAALAATTLLRMHSPAGWVLLPVVPLLAWSRLVLGRHTWVEVVLGVLIGAATGWLL